FNAKSNVEEEPVYNTDVAWPDDAPVVRAQDLGVRDLELAEYYEARQPQREFYLFDRGNGELIDLGSAGELATRMRTRLATVPQSAPAAAPASAPGPTL